MMHQERKQTASMPLWTSARWCAQAASYRAGGLEHRRRRFQVLDKHYGSSFKETTRDFLFCLAALTNTMERHAGAHHGLRTSCSPLRQATLMRLNSLHSVIKSPHFIWHRLIKRRICSVVNMDKLSRYSPLTPFSSNTCL
uniref:Uncharacterized protein n=1 Tax=Zea mays TaxID=4577 RepID=C0HGY9_MAIZE|nr:unknown [Zea mays]